MDRQDWLAKEGDTTNIKITSTNIRRKVEVNRFEGFVSIVLMLSRLGKWQLMSWRDFFASDFVFLCQTFFPCWCYSTKGKMFSVVKLTWPVDP